MTRDRRDGALKQLAVERAKKQADGSNHITFDDHATVLRDLDRAYLIRLRENLLDLDIEVDDRRLDLDQAVDQIRVSVQRRNDVARQLAGLLKELDA